MKTQERKLSPEVKRALRDEAMKLITLLKTKDYSNERIADYLGTTSMSLYRWRNNKSAPYPATVKLLQILCEKEGLQWVK